MSMKFTQLVTYWQADEALQMIDFLDQLRDKLWETYGEEIQQMHRDRAYDHSNDDKLRNSPFNDDVEF